MKFKKITEGNAHGNPPLYEFHLNLEEMKLLYGLLKGYILHSPRGEDWLPQNRRADNMFKALKEFCEAREQ